MAFKFIEQRLAARRETGLLRQRSQVASSTGAMIEVDGQHYLNFSSNDYLGQRQNMAVMQAWVEGISQYGVGSGASPLVTGYTSAHQALEAYLADSLQRDSVLLFNSGFAANQAICQVLGEPGVSVFADKLIHASFIEGMRSSADRFKRFRHNDIDHLQRLMAQAKGDLLVATEGVFSMDGDQAPLNQLSNVVNAHSGWLMVDDAHGFGVLGETGMGSIEQAGLSQNEVPILLGTFGKAVGTYGAFIAGSASFIEYLVNFARHYIYSTSMPPALASATLASLQSMESGEQRSRLVDNIAYFKQACGQSGISLCPSDTAIQPIVIGDPQRCVAISQKMKTLGIWVTAIRSPTVPVGQDRLRITLSASHHYKDIDALVDVLNMSLAHTPEAAKRA